MTTDGLTSHGNEIETHRDDVIGDSRALPALMTVACGLVILFCVGFMQMPAVHNGAHDTRHANGFPCH